jgi:hypothetical protein
MTTLLDLLSKQRDHIYLCDNLRGQEQISLGELKKVHAELMRPVFDAIKSSKNKTNG